MKKFRSLCLLFCLVIGTWASFAQTYQVTANVPAADMASMIAGPGVEVFNAVYKGAPAANGIFHGLPEMAMDSGIILTTGKAILSIGPNNTSNAGFDNNRVGDSTLTQLAGSNTHDASILEFDFIPQANIMEMKYFFASEEYAEYVNSFNDVVGIFLCGPGIDGFFSVTYYEDGCRNIAHVPETSPPLYVGINTINNGAMNTGPCTNCTWYLHNSSTAITYQNIQYDALTTVLVARHPVIPCKTYHIKIAIADCVDGIFDSAVLLKAGSLTSIGL